MEKNLAEQYNEECFRKTCQLKFELHEIYNKKADYLGSKNNFCEKTG